MNDNYLLGMEFIKRIWVEARDNASDLGADEIQVLRSKYRVGKKRRPLMEHNYACRLVPIISYLTRDGNGISLLDVGCGVGSESILFSHLGAQVLGVDLSPFQIGIAQRRLAYYQRLWQQSLNAEFVSANIFNALDDLSVDVIWVREAISHIYPVEKFLDSAANALVSGGYIFISDGNRWSPLWALRDLRERGLCRKRFIKRVDPNTGEEILYGYENALSVRWLGNQLELRGFQINTIRWSSFFADAIVPASLADLAAELDGYVSCIPLIRSLGLVYTLSAAKQ